MSTSIVEFIYGPNSNLMALKQPWNPSSGNYPADTTEGIVYLAQDDGIVSGEFYKTGSCGSSSGDGKHMVAARITLINREKNKGI